jgi:hypothetical protein
VRQYIPVEYRGGHSSYYTTYGPLYLEFTDLLLGRTSGDPHHAAPLIREARDTVEQLKETELQDYFRDSCITAFEAKRRSVDTISLGTAVLYPIVLPDRTELLVSFGEEQSRLTIATGAKQLREQVLALRQLLEKRTTNEYLLPARELYERIMRPLEPVLVRHRIDTLVIVPDSVLRLVPLAALYDGDHFVVERYATAIAPSLHLVDLKPLTGRCARRWRWASRRASRALPACPTSCMRSRRYAISKAASRCSMTSSAGPGSRANSKSSRTTWSISPRMASSAAIPAGRLFLRSMAD